MSSSIDSNYIGGRDGSTGAAGVDSKWEFISSATASASASIEFTGLSSTYFKYMIVYEGVAPATDNVYMILRTSTNNGSSYDSGASDYAFGLMQVYIGNRVTFGDDTASYIPVASDNGIASENLGNASNENCCGYIEIFNPSASAYTHIIATAVFTDEASEGIHFQSGGYRKSAADVDAVQITMSSGNISTGTFKLYGLKAA